MFCLSCFVCDQCRVTHQLTVDLEISFSFFFFEARTSFVWHRISVEPRKLFQTVFQLAPQTQEEGGRDEQKKDNNNNNNKKISTTKRKEKRLAQEERRQIGSRVNRRLSQVLV
jgi:hypothetical protein